MTAPAPEGTRTTLPPEGSAPAIRVRPETEAAGHLQRAVDEARDDVRACEAVIVAAQTKLKRALQREAQALAALQNLGITPTLDSAGEAPGGAGDGTA